MYCAHCGTPLTPGLSFCNRCGVSLKERGDSRNAGAITAFLTSITLLGILGLGIMLGGSVALRKGAELGPELVGFFMLCTFLIVGITEILLIRQLSRLTGSVESERSFPRERSTSNELRPPQLGTLGEPVSSVTENTTRTLEYQHRKQ